MGRLPQRGLLESGGGAAGLGPTAAAHHWCEEGSRGPRRSGELVGWNQKSERKRSLPPSTSVGSA